MKSEREVQEYLTEAENNAVVSMASMKWERFGYWAAQVTHLRRILGISSTTSPFREFAELARIKLAKNDGQGELLRGLDE